MRNPFKNRVLSLAGPAYDLEPVVPDDAHDLGGVGVSLYVETGGRLRFVTVKGELREVAVGDFAILPVGVTRVLATGTTAAGIHAFVVQ